MVKGMKAKWTTTSQQQVTELNSQLKVSKHTITPMVNYYHYIYSNFRTLKSN